MSAPGSSGAPSSWGCAACACCGARLQTGAAPCACPGLSGRPGAARAACPALPGPQACWLPVLAAWLRCALPTAGNRPAPHPHSSVPGRLQPRTMVSLRHPQLNRRLMLPAARAACLALPEPQACWPPALVARLLCARPTARSRLWLRRHSSKIRRLQPESVHQLSAVSCTRNLSGPVCQGLRRAGCLLWQHGC